MKHSVSVRVGRGIDLREKGAVLGCRNGVVRNRALSLLLSTIYGNPIPTLLIIPADSVKSISISEIAESGVVG